MKCKQIRRKLSAFLDNELKPKEALEVKEHLFHCSLCSKEAESLSAAWDFIGELQAIEPSQGFRDNLLRKIFPREERPFSYAFFKNMVQMPVPAAVSLILVIGLFLGTYLGNTFYFNVVDKGSEIAGQGSDNSSYLASFDDLPSDSVGGVYVKLVSQNGGLYEK